MTSEQRWAMVLGDRTEQGVEREAAERHATVASWLRAAVNEAVTRGMDDDPDLVLEDLLAQVAAIPAVYEAYRYAAGGHVGEPDNGLGADGAVIATGSIEECRKAIARALARAARYYDEVGDRSLADRRWQGSWSELDGAEVTDIEAYHESDEEGCGGWAIRPARP